MKVKLLVIISLISVQFGFSQTQTLLKGKVVSENIAMQGVEVINITTKKSASTNFEGFFSISAKAKDSLVFYSKDYYLKKMLLTQTNIDTNNLLVTISKKPEELEEVVITKMASIKLSKDKGYEQRKLDGYALEKAATAVKNPAVYTGTIENGIDFMRIGGMILGLFKKEKEPAKKTIPQIEFATLAKKTCDQKFYLENLKLKPDEIELFLQFCDADIKSKKIIEDYNILSMMDFLSIKNIEFHKLNGIEK